MKGGGGQSLFEWEKCLLMHTLSDRVIQFHFSVKINLDDKKQAKTIDQSYSQKKSEIGYFYS